MTRKRLADFLREEAKALDLGEPAAANSPQPEPKKSRSTRSAAEDAAPPSSPRSAKAARSAPPSLAEPVDGATEPPQNPKAKGGKRMAAVKTPDSPSTSSATSKTSAKLETLVSAPLPPDAPPAAENAPGADASTASPLAADPTLEVQKNELADLKTALKDAQAQEATLQHQVELLKTELEEFRELARQLKTGQSRTTQLEADLEEARKVILQLSELNTQLQATRPPDATQPSPAPLPAKTPPPAPLQTAAPRPAPPPRTELARSATAQPVHPHASVQSKMELRKVLQHPVTPTILPTTLSNDEIGWVD